MSAKPAHSHEVLAGPVGGRRQSAALIARHEDFAQPKVQATDGTVVIWIRVPITRRSDLRRRFDAALPIILSAIERGDALVLLRLSHHR